MLAGAFKSCEERERNPRDPRVAVPGYRPRGAVRYPRGRRPGWTVPMVAEAAGVSTATVKRARTEGTLDMNDLRSVSLFVAGRIARLEKRRARD